MGGDLNFSLGHSESWGHRAQRDPLYDYFENALDSYNLIDIPSSKLQPTWRNNRIWNDGLACRLDQFLFREKLLDHGFNNRQWVGSGGISDHFPIYMEIYGGHGKPKGPFKFFSTWLKDASYIHMVTYFWKRNPPDARGNIAKGFSHNLTELKRLSKIWAHNKRVKDDQALRQAESEIAEFENDQGGYIAPSNISKKSRIAMQREGKS